MPDYHFIRWFPSDYLRDTRQMSQCEHGAYFLLLNEYYCTGKPLPDDDRVLARITLSDTLSDWLAIRSVCAEHFAIRDGKWFHKRCDAEIEHAKILISARRKGAQATNTIKATLSDTLTGTLSGRKPGTRSQELRVKTLGTESKNQEPHVNGLPAVSRKKPREDSPDPTPGSLVWESYSDAIEERYGERPAKSSTSASLCKQFAKKIPEEDAPAVAAYYVRWNQQLYVNSCHCLELMSRDAMKLHLGWKSKTQVTNRQARDVDSLQGAVGMAERIQARIDRGETLFK